MRRRWTSDQDDTESGSQEELGKEDGCQKSSDKEDAGKEGGGHKDNDKEYHGKWGGGKKDNDKQEDARRKGRQAVRGLTRFLD